MKRGLLIILVLTIFLSIFKINNQSNISNDEILLSQSNNTKTIDSTIDGGSIAIIICSGIVVSGLIGVGLYYLIMKKK